MCSVYRVSVVCLGNSSVRIKFRPLNTDVLCGSVLISFGFQTWAQEDKDL